MCVHRRRVSRLFCVYGRQSGGGGVVEVGRNAQRRARRFWPRLPLITKGLRPETTGGRGGFWGKQADRGGGGDAGGLWRLGGLRATDATRPNPKKEQKKTAGRCAGLFSPPPHTRKGPSLGVSFNRVQLGGGGKSAVLFQLLSACRCVYVVGAWVGPYSTPPRGRRQRSTNLLLSPSLPKHPPPSRRDLSLLPYPPRSSSSRRSRFVC